jgi:phosphoglycerate dehydrogenase-like enzyme
VPDEPSLGVELDEEAVAADVYVGSRFTSAVANTAEKLKLIHVAGAGTDKVDFDALPHHMVVANTFHHDRSIAEYVVAAGLTGSGRVADVGLAWAADTGELDRLLGECDVAVVSAPRNEHTEGMIGAAQLTALGADGVLINVGRGPLVQERALYDALAGGVIRAAAIDVWYRYPAGDDVSPPADLPFAELPNLLMTPHSSGVTRDTFIGRVDDVVANIGRLKRGEPLRNVVHGG